ncbi:TIR domain-containing protein [endosymbiont of Tevnia jerichonana]|uniref:TIR domain-containing protein n=1 Tax=endosymbiont of Tevnia jerichonana TaxID=94785 RepID=UPI0005948FAA
MQPITQPQSQKFQVALSFAGEDRAFSEAVAKGLKRNGISVFYDNDCQGELWGADLPVKLREIYNKESQYCMLFLSDHYKKRCGLITRDNRLLKRLFQHLVPSTYYQ